MQIDGAIFRKYDIRGIVGESLDKDIAYNIGKSFGSLLLNMNPNAQKVSIGRDVRLSSEELASALIDGIISTGLDVYDIGICPTPLQYFSIYHLNLDGGIMVTGSHNPPEYNGFKLSIGKDTIHGETIQTLKEIIQKDAWANAGKRAVINKYDIIKAYKEYMLNEFSYLARGGYKKLKIVVDAGNGTAGIIAPELFRQIGCEVIPLYCEPDGRFPNHHPDPTVVEYIQDLIKTTKEVDADFGVGYDGDADRIGVIDRDGNTIWGDQLIIILCRDILKQHKGARVVGDVKCSQAMFDDIKRNGGVPVMWNTGHSLIKKKMRDEKALLAGEFSGHIFIADRYFGYDDAIYATLRLIEIIKKTGKDINDLLTGVPRMFYTPEIRIECADEIKHTVVQKVVEKFKGYKENGNSLHKIIEINTIDGIRVVFEKGWGLVRVSNTQPVIVMRFEAEDEAHLNIYRTFMEQELLMMS